jgi:uroporphyrinogen-III synthase
VKAVVVTRPLAEATRWAERLQERGMAPIVLPLIAIGPAPDLEALSRAASAVNDYAAVMFVSANAVQGFFAASPSFLQPRAWAPGPATREALRAAGVGEVRIDAPAQEAAQFDSESLWQQVQGQLRRGDRLLLVRGADAGGRSQGRDWLAQQLTAAGVQVESVTAYCREVPTWDGAMRSAAARAAQDGSLWLFSSSEAAANLAALLPEAHWQQARALATHPRIAQAVRSLGFGSVQETRPAFEDVVASIESAA